MFAIKVPTVSYLQSTEYVLTSFSRNRKRKCLPGILIGISSLTPSKDLPHR